MEAKTNNETKKTPAKRTPAKKTTEQKVAVNESKKFNPNDLITCMSITNGELLMVGEKTKYLYKWADYGSTEDVEYQDLLYDARSNSANSNVMYPRFIILDDDFISQNKSVASVYEKFYDISDLKDMVLSESANELITRLPLLPAGIQTSVKGLVATLIEEGTLDSITKIKALDKYFGTNFLLTLKDS